MGLKGNISHHSELLFISLSLEISIELLTLKHLCSNLLSPNDKQLFEKLLGGENCLLKHHKQRRSFKAHKLVKL